MCTEIKQIWEWNNHKHTDIYFNNQVIYMYYTFRSLVGTMDSS